MPLSPWLELYAAALGLIVGSFLNVVVARLPRGVSLVYPRSRCPYCAGAIAARDNLPVLGWLLLGGRCRRCRAPISPRYPLVEALTGVLFVACVVRFGARPAALVAALLCCLLLVLAGIDADWFILPDAVTFPGIAAGLLLQRWIPGVTWLDALVGALAGAGLVVLLANLWYWLRGEEGMGLGDANMLAMLGAFLGWQGVLVTFLVGVVLGAAGGLALVAAGGLGMRSRIPFGVFLAAGGLTALFVGPVPVERWLGLA